MRPLLGRKIDAMEAAWLTGNAQERQEIEIVLQLLHRQAVDRWSTLLEAPPDNQADGSIRLGRVRHGRHVLGHVGLDPGELLQHTLITGRSGAGKSNLVHHVLLQLMDKGISWLAFDSKRSTRALAALPKGDSIRILTLGRDPTFLFNPLAAPPGVPFDAHVRQFVELICKTYTGGDAVASVLIRTIEGLAARLHRAPTFLEARREVERDHHSKGRSSMWRQTTLRILDQLTTGPLGTVFNTKRDANALHGLREGHTILETDGHSRKNASFIVQLILRFLHYSMLATPHREQLKLLVCLEEAQELAPHRDAGASESIVETTMRQARESGMGLLLASQDAASLSHVVQSNVYTTVSFNLRSQSDIAAASRTLLLDRDGAAMLSSLPVGQAICRLSGRWPRAIHMDVPHIPVPKGALTDRDVLARGLIGQHVAGGASKSDSAVSADSGVMRGQNAVQAAIPPLPRERSVVSTRDSTSHPEQCLLPDAEQTARSLLIDIVTHPFDSVASRYRRLGLSGRKGHAARGALVSEGLVEAKHIPVPEGQLLLFEVSDIAKAWCVRHRISITPVNGSIAHGYWQRRVADQLKSHGWSVSCEHEFSGKRVDVFASKADRQLVLEIETGKGNLANTVDFLSDLEGYQRFLLWLGKVRPPVLHELERNGVTILRSGNMQAERWMVR